MAKNPSMISSWLNSQFVDIKSVRLSHRYNDGYFFLNSSAGMLRIKPKKEEICHFRNVYLNKFEDLMRQEKAGVLKRNDLFRFYRVLRKRFKHKYFVNFRTRLRGFLVI